MPGRASEPPDRALLPASASSRAEVFEFDDFVFDTARGELRRAGDPVAAGQQTLLLLEQLVRTAGRPVSREAIQAAVWPGTSVSETSLRQAIWELRQLLGDSAATPRFVQTLRGRGYRFLMPVTSVDQAVPTPSHALSAHLVGRDAEHAQLREALASAQGEAGRACILRGAPGIGKSRLARAVVRDAAACGVICVECAGERESGRPPFWPWMQLLDGLLSGSSGEQRAGILAEAPLAARLLAQLSDRAAGTQALFSEGPDLQRLYLFEELTRTITAVVRKRPVLLLLEDVQWFDEASLAFLGYFGAVLPRTRTLLLLTSRNLARRENRPLARALDALGRGALNQVVELTPLSLAQIAQLLERCGHATATPELARDVHALTLGNPLYTVEIARLLGRAAPASGDTLLCDPPRALRDVIERRLTGLPEACLEAARAASVWGDECSVAELAALIEEPVEAALERLDECVRHGILIERTAGLRFGFSHPLVAEVAYGQLSTIERGRLHLLAGGWLEQRSDKQGAQLDALAHHFYCAAASGGAQKAVTYATVCAERAFAATAFETALRHLDRVLAALELLPTATPEEMLALEVARAEALRAAGGDAKQVDALFLSLATRARALGAHRLLARAALGYDAVRAVGHMLTSFALQQNPVRIALLEEARAGIDPAEIELRAQLACALSFALTYGPARARRAELADEGLTLAREVGSPALVAHALSFVSYTCSAPDAYEKQRWASEQLVTLARRHNLKEIEFGACLQRIVLALYTGNLHDAEREDARAGVLAAQLGSERAVASSQLLPLIKAFWQGDIAEAERLTDAIYRAQPSDLVQYQAVHITRKSALEVLRRGHAQLPPLIASAQAVLALAPDAVSGRATLASALAATGQHEQARAHFDDLARDDFAALPEESSWLGDMIGLADCAVRLDDPQRAERVYARLLPFRARMSFFYCDAFPAGPVARGLAELATVLGDFGAAEELLSASRALNKQLGASMFLLYDALAEARLLAAKRTPQWRPRVGSLLREVASAAARTENRWLVDCARTLQSSSVHLAAVPSVRSS